MSGQGLSLLLSILVAVFSLALIGTLLGRYVYKRQHRLPTGDCACCCSGMKRALKQYQKQAGK